MPLGIATGYLGYVIWPAFLNANSRWSVALLFVSVGAATGTGLAQWMVLRRRVSHAGWWVLASILGWGLALLIAGRFDGRMLLELVITGAVHAVVTGLALWWLLAIRRNTR